MRYQDHEYLVVSARGERGSPRFFVMGCLAIVVIGYVLMINYVDFFSGLFDPVAEQNEDSVIGATPTAMFAVLFSFVVWIVSVALAVRFVHHRSFGLLLGTQVWPHFVVTIWALFILNVVVAVLPPWGLGLPEDVDVIWNMPWTQWLLLLPLSLGAVLIQVSAEEILFRGYLQQQLAALVRAPIVWIGVPSVLFGLLHYDPEMGGNTWLIVFWACVFGALMADITARSGSLGPAIALHLSNNVLAMLIFSGTGDFGGLALLSLGDLRENEEIMREMLYLDFAMMFVCWLAARLTLRR